MDERDLEWLSKEELLGLVRRLQSGSPQSAERVEEAGRLVEHDVADMRFGVYHGEAPGTDAEALRVYRDGLAHRCSEILLSGFEGGVRQRRLALEQIYVDLDTRREVSDWAVRQALKSGQPLLGNGSVLVRPQDLRPLSALEAVALHRRLVLLGDPGAGKTTLIRRLTLALASGRWEGLERWPASGRDRLPVLVLLRDFARWLGARPAEPGPDLLWEYLRHDLAQRQLGFMEERNLLQAAIAEERLQVFLDGLDEVPPELRDAVLSTVAAFAERYPQVWMLVTCRVASYAQGQWRLPADQFSELRLAPLNRNKILRFVAAWYQQMAAYWNEPQERTRSLAARLGEALDRPELIRLAGNPLLLTVMALVHSHDRVLPDHRAMLYERTVDILMWRWGATRAEHSSEPELLMLLREAGASAVDLLRTLRRLAFDAHAQGGEADKPEQVSGVAETVLREALADLHPLRSPAWAGSLIECIRTRSGLLVEREPGLFTFPHRTFQEYLAGVQLALHPHFPAMAVRLAEAGDLWREVILLAVGYRVHAQGELHLALDLVNALCPPRGEPTRAEGWRKIRLAGEVLLELGPNRIREFGERGERLSRRVRRQLAALLEQGRLHALERAHAGEVLGSLGDPRFDPELCFLPRRYHGEAEPTGGFVKIHAGIFWMGSERGDSLAADEREFGNPNPLKIPYDYWIGRYPVTVAQFGAFVADGGYGQERWWRTEAGRVWLRRRQVTAPGDWEAQRQHPNWPVAVVTWFEAMAYCTWLEERLRALERSPLPAGYRLRLPTEAEWEKAGRGARRICYPWGNGGWDRQHANVRESNIGHCTPVGMYPAGAVLSGLQDMAGNVWEWTLSGYADYPYDPGCNDVDSDNFVLRGGSWFDGAGTARCAVRISASPDLRSGNLGFRAVVSVAGAPF